MTRVLVVDDHDAFRAVVRTVLEQAGPEYGPEYAGGAGDGASAVITAEALSPHVVLLDVGLPDADDADRLAATSARGFVVKADLTASTLSRLLR